MDNIFSFSLAFMLVFLISFFFIGKSWSNNLNEFLFANKSLKMFSSGAAIGTHWIWAIALFVGPAAAYNWGTIGLIWFLVPNALALLVVGYLVRGIRDKYPDGFSLTAYVKENFSRRIAVLYQFEFLVVATGALLLAFTAISKLWGFAGLGSIIDPLYASLIIGLITLGFTLKGGIRTSIFTGVAQTMLWGIFSVVSIYYLMTTDVSIISFGKNNLETLADTKFLSTFAVAYIITILASSSGHGHLWQKAFSMPKENIIPSFAIGSIIFSIILAVFLSLATYAFSSGLTVKAPDLSSLTSIVELMGVSMFVLFGVMFVTQTSTVIDSSMNYVASLITLEWLHKDQVWLSRLVMTLFLLLAWIISWSKIEIWTIMMFMGAVRTVMVIPLIMHVLDVKLKEQLVFYTSLVGISGTFYLAWTAKMDKLPIYDMYAAIYGIAVPTVVYLSYKLLNKSE
jgi:Na+/proline symporter